MAGAIVEVDPASVLAAATELRAASKHYSATGWRLSTSLPLMPPPFLARVQAELDAVAMRLQALAVRLDVDAATEGWRVSTLVDAGAGDLGGAVGQLLSDLGSEGRQAWDQLSQETGPQTLVDPVGGNVQLVLGGADTICSSVHTVATVAQVTPAYAAADPVGATRARQDIVAMVLNLLLLSPEAATIDPERHQAAVAATGRRVTDVQDLEHANVPRWAGHVGTGLLLIALSRGLAPADAAVSAEVRGSTGGREAAATGFEMVGTINHLPTDGPEPGTAQDRSVFRRTEARLLSHLEPMSGR